MKKLSIIFTRYENNPNPDTISKHLPDIPIAVASPQQRSHFLHQVYGLGLKRMQ